MYSELQTISNFSFLRGASHPQELVWRAAELGYKAIALTDYNTLSSVVRAHASARESGITCLVGCRIEIEFQSSLCSVSSASVSDRSSQYLRASLLLYPTSRASYGSLCRLLTMGKSRVSKNDFLFSLSEFLPYQKYFVTVVVPPYFKGRLHLESNRHNEQNVAFYELCSSLRENVSDPALLSIAITQSYGPLNQQYVVSALQTARSLGISIVATNDVHYHVPERRPLQDVLSCIREKCTIDQAGLRLFANGERYLKPPHEMVRLFREIPSAISRTQEIVEIGSQFSLSQLTYNYPREIYPFEKTPLEYLTECTYLGALERYPHGIPAHVNKLLEEELVLIHELEYEKYFLTCYDIVKFARSRDILCQGRGAAANSAVCYCLGITSVDPTKIDLLFARFVSKERREPPDIDIDFEHERREEVIQYIYTKYGRDRAAIASEVVTYRPRSAIREVGKVLGLSLEIVDQLAKSVHRWTECKITADTLRDLGLNPFDATVQNALVLSSEIVGFPRHLSQHVGGFIISEEPLCEIVPIINAGMENRTIIEWDKNDIEELGMLKIDILALGMLTCIRKALDLVNEERTKHQSGIPLQFHTIPSEAPEVYDMLCAADSLGVFQVESRAQMSMLPRLKPRTFYDLVIEVALVRPGPIQGNMVHPYLRRRSGLERAYYPDERVKEILGKTLGVPIFQEQAMKLVIMLANFSPGEAERLRRAIGAWKSNKKALDAFTEKITLGMLSNGYSREFAETCINQIKGFSEYGFPESHAASFALIVYASAWLKHHYPAQFACALLNSQPMGFYAPSQIVRDAQKHGVIVREIDVNRSSWSCSIEYDQHSYKSILRLGMRLISGLRENDALQITESIQQHGEAETVSDLWNRSGDIPKRSLKKLAQADAFTSIEAPRRTATWDIQELPSSVAPLDSFLSKRAQETVATLPEAGLQGDMFADYAVTGLSLRAHPIQFARESLTLRTVKTAEALSSKYGLKPGTPVAVAGLAIIKQRPGTAKGVVFITIEDETSTVNLIIRPDLFERFHKIIIGSAALLARGLLERIGDVVYIDVRVIEGIDDLISSAKARKYPIRSYSY